MDHPSKGNFVVYQATNLKNNKIYIGSTIRTLKETKYSHKHCANKGDSRPIYQAINKHGFYNFIYNIMGEFQSKDEAYEFKEVCVKEFNAMNPKYGYNCTTGRLDKYVMNKQTRERISKIQEGKIMPKDWVIWLKDQIKNNPNKYKSFKKGYKHTEEAKANMRLGQLNSDYIQTEEIKKRKSETMKRRWKEPAVIEKMKNRKRSPITEETRKKMSIANSGKNNSMYGIRGKDHPCYGRIMSEEQKQKMAIGRNKYQDKKRKERRNNDSSKQSKG